MDTDFVYPSLTSMDTQVWEPFPQITENKDRLEGMAPILKAVVKKLISDATRAQSKVLRETALNSGLVSKQVQDPKI